MKRFVVILYLLTLVVVTRAGYVSVNFDAQTTLEMGSALSMQFIQEEKTRELWDKILGHYGGSEIATAGIFASKLLDRNALKDEMSFGSEENWYYRHIRQMVAQRIMPRIFTVATMLIQRPDKAIYWGPYLYKTTEEVRNLCMIFQTVCSNGKLSFKDLHFLVIVDELRDIFNLTNFGGIDWERLWDNLTNVGDITWQDIEDDFTDLMTAGGVIASAGGAILDDLWVQASKSGNIFHMKPKEIWQLGNQYKDIYESLNSVTKVKDALMNQIQTTDSTGVMRLFKFDEYNISNYVSNYLHTLMGEYYKQRWYIYEVDNGSEVVCDWCPYEPNASMNGWYTVATFPDYIDYNDGAEMRSLTDCPPPSYYVIDIILPSWNLYFYGSEARQNSIDNFKSIYGNYAVPESAKEAAKQVAAEAAGWSYAYINSLNSQNNGEYYSITFPSYHERNLEKTLYYKTWGEDRSTNMPSAKVCSWCVKVTRSWNKQNVIYEEEFDSYNMSESAFEQYMTGKLMEIQGEDAARNNTDEAVHVYRIGKDEKRYYSASDEKRMHGCTAVEFWLNCENGAKLAEGSTEWKVNKHHPDWAYYKEDAMSSTLSNEGDDLQDYQDKIKQCDEGINSRKEEIKVLESRQKELLDLIANTSDYTQAQTYQEEYKNNRDKINKKNQDIQILQDTRQKAVEAYNIAYGDYANESDNIYHIPAIMRECVATYGVTWEDEGHWEGEGEGCQFIRNGKIENKEANIVFRATLNRTRDETWVDCGLFSLRTHRSIIRVNWVLESNYSTSDQVDVMTFSNDMPESDRSNAVNQRQQEIMAEHPNCSVELRYQYSDNDQQEEDPGTYHLLWMSDRLRIAREVDYRLVRINSQLVLLEKYLRSSKTILEYITAPYFDALRLGMRGAMSNESFRRWRQSTKDALNAEKLDSIRQSRKIM